MKHHLHPAVRAQGPFKILLIGAGGTGSRLIPHLKSLHHALLAMGQAGIKLIIVDPDVVSESNLVRQNFFPAEVGRPKATVLANRLKETYQVPADALVGEVKRLNLGSEDIHLVISAVDNRSARADLHKLITHRDARVCYLLDCGNMKNNGQVIIGQPDNPFNAVLPQRLQTSFELYPEVMNRRRKDHNLPSCSALESLNHQDLFINEAIAVAGANLIWRLLRYRELDHQGIWVNLEDGMQMPMPIQHFARDTVPN